jgi:hypothetical protein
MDLVDRGAEKDLFRDFISSPDKPWILYLEGLNGMGKSSLLGYFAQELTAGCLSVWMDFSQKNLCEDAREVVASLSDDLKAAFPRPAWKKFQSRLEEVNARRQIIATNQIIARQNAVVTSARQNINLSIDLEQEQLQVRREMAHAWGDLLKTGHGRVVFFGDHWDLLSSQASPGFSTWMVEDLLLRSRKERSIEFKVVLAGDDFPRNEAFFRAASESGDLLLHSLQPLELEDARTLMRAKKIGSEQLQTVIYQKVGGNPLLIGLAADLHRENPTLDWTELEQKLDERAHINWFLDRIAQSLTDERSRLALNRGVVLQRWKLDMLKAVCDCQDMDLKWYSDFASHSFVQDEWKKKGYKQFVRSVREVQLRQLWFEDEKQFHQLHHKALDWYENEERPAR